MPILDARHDKPFTTDRVHTGSKSERVAVTEQRQEEKQEQAREERVAQAVEEAPPSVAVATAQEEGNTPSTPQQHRVITFLEPLFDNVSLGLYVVVATLLLLLTLAALVYALLTLPESLRGGVPKALTSLLSELLLVLILVELIRTIGTFITTRASSIRPFLTIAIISSVRRILSVGAELSLEDLSGEAFNHAVIELGVEGGLILIVALSLFLVSRREGG